MSGLPGKRCTGAPPMKRISTRGFPGTLALHAGTAHTNTLALARGQHTCTQHDVRHGTLVKVLVVSVFPAETALRRVMQKKLEGKC